MSNVLDREFTRATELELYNEFGNRINGYKAIVNSNDDRHVFNVATNTYEIIQHEDVSNAVVQSLKNVGVEYKPIRVTDMGKRMYIEFDLPTIKHDVAKVGDIINLRIGVYNSYDGSMGVRVETYGHRLRCSNGMWVSEMFDRYYSRHIRGIDLESIQTSIVTGIAAFQDNFCGKLENYANHIIKEESALEFIEDCKENKVIPLKYLDAIQGNITGRTGADIEPVNNKWMLYNSITEVLTHDTADIFTQRRNIKKMDRLMLEYSFAA